MAVAGYCIEGKDGFRAITLGLIGLINTGCVTCRSVKLHCRTGDVPEEDRTFASKKCPSCGKPVKSESTKNDSTFDSTFFKSVFFSGRPSVVNA